MVIKVINVYITVNLLLMGKLEMLSFSQKYFKKDSMKVKNSIKSHFVVFWVLFFFVFILHSPASTCIADQRDTDSLWT